MNPTTIKALLDPNTFSDGMIVMCVKGQLTKLFDAKSGSGDNGAWEFQSGELKDSTGTIRISFSSNTQPKTSRNKTVTIKSVKSANHGFQGIKIEDRTYTDKDGNEKSERQLKVTGTAEITYEGQGSGNPPPGNKTQGTNGGATGPAKPNDTRHPKLVLADMVALYSDIQTLVNETIKDAPVTAVPTLFIEAAKNGLVYDYKVNAAKPVPVKYPPAPKDPSEWRKCVVPFGKDDVIGKTLEQVSDEKLEEMFNYFDQKGTNTPLAECVYQAARDRGIIKPEPEPQPTDTGADLDVAPDDIPF